MAERQVDILIVGGGLTGATLMLALADLGFSTLLVEAKSFSKRIQNNFDARTLALAPASVRILQMLNIWPLLHEDASAIDTIHVSEQHCFGTARLQGEEHSPLGYVVEMQSINRALHHLLDHQHVIAPAELTALNHSEGLATINTDQGEMIVRAQLIVAADGADSSVRRLCGMSADTKDYGQVAIVANIGLARPHQQQAYERFTAAGPMALLPMKDLRSSLVWSLSPKDAQILMASDDSNFLKALHRAFGYRLGRLLKVGQRVVYPLQQVMMKEHVVDRVVFVGNAAHTLHPVAGQGFNLGLRDVACLAQCIAEKGITTEMLSMYLQARAYDQAAISRFTDGLVELFTCRAPGLSALRGAGLIMLDNIPLLKRCLARYAGGFSGIIPDLVCGLPLRSLNESIV